MSKWNKLLNKIKTMNQNVRFDELKKYLKVIAIQCTPPEVAVAILLFEKMDPFLLQSPKMNLSKKSMLKWCDIS